MNKTLLTLLCVILTTKSQSLPKEPIDSHYCSLIQSKEDCLQNQNCIFAEVRFRKFYKIADSRCLCYHKQFIIRSMKARIFPADFMGTPDARLLEMAKLDTKTDLTIPENIRILVKELISQQKIDFITSLELL